MILAAGLLVLLGLGLFVAGIGTGVTVLYWACVAVCVVAAVLLVLVRRQPATKAPVSEETTPAEPATSPAPAENPETVAKEEPPADAAAAGAGEKTPSTADAPAAEETPDPGIEEVEVTDLLLVVDLTDEVLVVDEHPRYHLAECTWLAGRETIPLPLDEARSDGFTPCAVCSPDRTLAQRARAAKQSGA